MSKKVHEELCQECGRDLKSLGQYADFVHYRPGTITPCLPMSAISKVLANELADRFEATAKLLDQTILDSHT